MRKSPSTTAGGDGFTGGISAPAGIVHLAVRGPGTATAPSGTR